MKSFLSKAATLVVSEWGMQSTSFTHQRGIAEELEAVLHRESWGILQHSRAKHHGPHRIQASIRTSTP